MGLLKHKTVALIVQDFRNVSCVTLYDKVCNC
jgi:hypothetical protein